MKKYIAIFTYYFNSTELNGFKIMTETEMDIYNDLVEGIFWDFKFEIGETNIEFTDGLELLSYIDFKPIPNEEFKSLSKTFENGKFGTFVDQDYLQTIVSDEEESSIDDDTDDDSYIDNGLYSDEY